MFLLDDSERFSDVLESIATVLRTRDLTLGDFKNLKYRTVTNRINQFFTLLWQAEIEDIYINDGKFEQFSALERAFIMPLRRPTLTNFRDFKQKITARAIVHPIKAKMLEVLLDMSEIIDMVESLNEIGRHDVSKSALISSS